MTPLDTIIAALEECHEAMGYMSEYDIPLCMPERTEKALTLVKKMRDGGWRPIAELDTDDDFFLVSDGEFTFLATWEDGSRYDWSICGDSDPCNLASEITHYMPLPLPPKGDL